MSVITEIDSIITLLESEIPANPNAPANQRQRRRLQKEVAKYFDKLEDAFPYSSLEKIYNRYVEKE